LRIKPANPCRVYAHHLNPVQRELLPAGIVN
jgi:hypothetical protein